MNTDNVFVICGAIVTCVLILCIAVPGHAEKMACIKAQGIWHDRACDARPAK